MSLYDDDFEADAKAKAKGHILGELCEDAGLYCPADAKETLVSGITHDSRRVRDGYIFIALLGLHDDGSKYIDDAVKCGAVAVVTDGRSTEDVTIPIIHTNDARVAMARLFSAYYMHPERRLRLIGVTGTNGKTTVASMIYHVMNSCGRPTGVIGTLGAFSPCKKIDIHSAYECANMTTPDPEELYAIMAQMRDEGVRYVAMEVSSHALALGKVEPLDFEVGIFTNLTPEHLDIHGDMDGYYAAKRRLFDRSRIAVINADDRYGRLMLGDLISAERRIACHMSGHQPYADCLSEFGISATCAAAEQIKLEGGRKGGIEYLITTPSARIRLECAIGGRFNVMNSMQAALAVLEMGLSPSEIRAAFASFGGVKGRMERVELCMGADFSVYIDYAHTPDALENLLSSAHAFKKRCGRIVLLFGCGGERDRSKRREMAHIASRMADFTVITSDNSRGEDPNAIISDILKGIDKESSYAIIPERAEAIRYVVRHACRGDIILLAGKGHEEYEIDKNGRRPFSEREIVSQAAEEYWGISHE